MSFKDWSQSRVPVYKGLTYLPFADRKKPHLPCSGSIFQMSSGFSRPFVITAPSPGFVPAMMMYTGAAVGV